MGQTFYGKHKNREERSEGISSEVRFQFEQFIAKGKHMRSYNRNLFHFRSKGQGRSTANLPPVAASARRSRDPSRTAVTKPAQEENA